MLSEIAMADGTGISPEITTECIRISRKRRAKSGWTSRAPWSRIHRRRAGRRYRCRAAIAAVADGAAARAGHPLAHFAEGGVRRDHIGQGADLHQVGGIRFGFSFFLLEITIVFFNFRNKFKFRKL